MKTIKTICEVLTTKQVERILKEFLFKEATGVLEDAEKEVMEHLKTIHSEKKNKKVSEDENE